MSDTPMTDADIRLCKVTSESFGAMVRADFARQLECQLAEANARIADKDKALENHRIACKHKTDELQAKLAELCGSGNYLLATQLDKANAKVKELEAKIETHTEMENILTCACNDWAKRYRDSEEQVANILEALSESELMVEHICCTAIIITVIMLVY